MAGIVINSNFDLNQGVPIDSRLVATSSSVRNNILYKYDGLKVYQTDDKKTYVWNGTQWNIEGSGIYGGSGSLLGDTLVSFGSVGNFSGNDSYELAFGTDNGNTKSRMVNRFYRHSAVIPNFEYGGLEFRQQLSYFNSSGAQIPSSYIGFNSNSTLNSFGDITFNTGDGSVYERMRISSSTGNVGIRTDDPREYLQIGDGSVLSGYSMPITFHKGGNAIIGYNWYYDNGDFYFDAAKGSSRISQSDGEITFTNRLPNASSFVQSLHLSKEGKVGVGTGFDNNNLPSYLLDVNGSLRANNAKINTSLTASNVFSTNYYITNSPYFVSGNINYFEIKKSVLSTETIFKIDGISDNVNIYKPLNVSGNTNINGGSLNVTNDITSTGTTGKITNYEDPTLLVPNSNVYWSKNGNFNGGTNGGNYTLSSFTYSFSFYRVGALVHLDYVVKWIGAPFTYATPTDQFYGWAFKFNNSRFKPTTLSIGAGSGGYYSNAIKTPVVSVMDPNSGGVNPTLTGNEFLIKIQTFNGLSENPTKQGGDFWNITMNNLAFRGTLTYIASANPVSFVAGNDQANDTSNQQQI